MPIGTIPGPGDVGPAPNDSRNLSLRQLFGSLVDEWERRPRMMDAEVFGNIGGQGGPRGASRQPQQGDIGGFGGGGASFLSSLLSPFGDSEQLDGMGELFRTLLALQGQQGPQEGDIFSLFSGIQL